MNQKLLYTCTHTHTHTHTYIYIYIYIYIAIEKETFGSPSTTVANFTYLYIYIYIYIYILSYVYISEYIYIDQVGECKKTKLSHGMTLSTWKSKFEFPYKGNLRRFTNTSQPFCLRLTTSDRCRACGKTASLKHILYESTRGDITKSLRFLPRPRRYVVRLPIKL